jgi:hypothetical protein
MEKWYLHPFYIFNGLLCLIYPIIRYYGINSPHLQIKDSWGYKKESHIFGAFTTLVVLRYARYFSNAKKFINEIFFYSKCGTAMLLFFISGKLACWFLFACAGR